MMDLVRACYGEQAEPPAWWRWRHFAYDPERTAIYLATARDRIVGMRPMTLFDYTLRGERVVGALFSAVMVHPEYRRKGIFTRLVATCLKEAFRRGAVFANTMPNETSYAGFRKLGWHDPGARTLLVHPLAFVRLAEARMGGLASALPLRWPLARASEAYSRIFVRQRDVGVRFVDNFGEEVGPLSCRFAQGYPGIMLERPSAWWRWRFARQPWNNYRCLEARDGAGRLIGAAVTNLEHREGMRVGYLVEVLGAPGRCRRDLARAALEGLRTAGADLCLSVVSDPRLTLDLMRAGFAPIPRSISPKRFLTMYYPAPGQEHRFRDVKSIRSWYQTLGDWDGI